MTNLGRHSNQSAVTNRSMVLWVYNFGVLCEGCGLNPYPTNLCPLHLRPTDTNLQKSQLTVSRQSLQRSQDCKNSKTLFLRFENSGI